MEKTTNLHKGLKDRAPKADDRSTGKSGSPGGSVNDSPTRKSPPKITAPGSRTA